jgi:two-component system sensor histidine kinase and response regulator WspE
MLELFRVEAETQSALLTAGLLELERGTTSSLQLETLMRAAHSFKGAAKIVNFQLLVGVAHALEDCFVAAQAGNLILGKTEVDLLLRGVDLMSKVSRSPETDPQAWERQNSDEVADYLKTLCQMFASAAGSAGEINSGANERSEPASFEEEASTAVISVPGNLPAQHPSEAAPSRARGKRNLALTRQDEQERVVRLTAENLNRLLGLAGESLVESRWLRPFADSLQRLKRQQAELAQKLDAIRLSLPANDSNGTLAEQLQDALQSSAEAQQFLVGRMEELDLFDRRAAQLSHRLYLEVLRTRMRPFGDGTRRFPRMVRDLARTLGKDVRLTISGDHTQVDRDILERLETPVAHLLRNAVDHGCEAAGEREKSGKAPECLIQLDAHHSAGMLVVTVADDGAGVDFARLREVVIAKKLAGPAVVEKLSEAELLEFLFLPGFTMKQTVTEISGRGVGLDIVHNMVKSVRGAIRISSESGAGLKIQLHLPLTLSVLRALLVEIDHEPYAFPLTQIVRTLRLPRQRIETMEGRHFFREGNEEIGLVTAHQVLDCGQPLSTGEDLPVIIIGDRNVRYGLVVDRFLGERELVVQPLDSRLGKLQDITAAALMEDGSPVLIIDVDDLLRSVEKLVASGSLANVAQALLANPRNKSKRILAVDDSLTVRELERKLLTSRGYITDVAVDGMDGWNAVRTGEYDLVLTDVDMPRMDGIELASLIKRDPRLKSLPVMIVSYKDHEQDRLRGLEAGADYYLTKGSFSDESLIQAVIDLIGAPEE